MITREERLKILIWPGSLRQGSFNRQLANVINSRLVEKGVETDLIEFRDFDMPLFNADIQEKNGIPDATNALADRIVSSDGFVLVMPEYNFGVPGPVKNAIDWLSRIRPYPTAGKVCLLASAAPGQVGGARGIIALRPALSFMGAWLVPESFSLAQASNAFSENNQLKNSELEKLLNDVIGKFIAAAGSFRV